MMQVNTVLGKIDSHSLGITSPHEHIFVDITAYYKKPNKAQLRKYSLDVVNLKNLGFIKRNVFKVRDNLILNDPEISIEELLEYKEAGGKTIVDVTNSGMGRNPKSLEYVSRKTGLNIIAGCGFYIEQSHPSFISRASVDQISETIITETIKGINNTGILPGIIGEIGVSEQMTANEEKVIRAAAGAHRESNLSITVHLYPWKGSTALQILDILEQEKVPLKRVIMSHVDCNIELHNHKAVADRGAYIEYDNFGKEYYMDDRLSQNPRDTDRIDTLFQLIIEGYGNKILMATDVCTKIDLHSYGGWGYDHILTNIIPRLKKKGLSNEMINEILVTNPRKALTGE
jgi:phosphotriesterase-related protein